jgi:hypothetical protein
MRICPTCSAFYADESLTFCLVDGKPLVGVDAGSEKWSEGSRAIEKKGNALRKQQRKLKWRRVLMSATTMVVATVVVCVVTLNGVFYFKPSVFPVPSLTPSPQPSISGRVTAARGPLGGVSIRLGGTETDSATTNADGYYTFAKLQAGGNYTVTPVWERMSFTPASQPFNNLHQDEPANFSALDVYYKISGRVTDVRGPLGGVSIRLGGTKTDSATTNADGYYTFAKLQAGGNYTVTPVRERMSFTPASQPFNNLHQDEPANFTGVAVVADVVPDKDDSPPIKTCTEADQDRERATLLSKYTASWERSIAAEKSKVIADAIAAEHLPAGVEPRAIEATASLGSIRYEVTFVKCKPRVVTARYKWAVQLYLPGRGIKVVAVPKHKTCEKVIGVWVCR